ncbi:MAG: bifunctional phosphoribosylaminoimidazolecarboxamide formyltransferase/IMP cyclohydrolase [Xanthomonadales bacterium]|nr:bifunctional phosphoribosylaminoimidazolecarboxamide formyltransferase/IMP cyclohydrolase [Xanthomonadales bacterium]
MNGPKLPVPRLALVSVSDKDGIVEFASRLAALGFSLLSTGGTARHLADSGLTVTEVSDHTGFPEIMAGRVKTLHPRIHGGLLGRAGTDDAVMAEQDIPRIALAVINLYPFDEVTRDPGCSLEKAIENIDIGGPAMVRSAAKNYAAVGVVTSKDQYAQVLAELERNGGELGLEFRFELAVAAFNRIAQYDAAISSWLSALTPQGERMTFPGQANACFRKIMDLRYGENPHQRAAWYGNLNPQGSLDAQDSSLSAARQLQGKELSFNNIADADAAWACVTQFTGPACVIVKHANPCGVAVAETLLAAYDQAYATDPTSAFGGIIAFNAAVDAATAETLLARQFVEVLLAPGFSSEALQVLARKQNVRVLCVAPGKPVGNSVGQAMPQQDFKRISGGLLVQTTDLAQVRRADCRVVSKRAATDAQWNDLLFAWNVVKMVKSNAIVYAAAGRTLGIGAGQMSRVDSARIARWKAAEAGLDLAHSVMASDAFFPFRDSIDMAAEAGISGVIQPGGSMRDEEVIAAADEHDLVMVFTGMRHFRH